MRKSFAEKTGKDLRPLIIESAREVFGKYGLKKATMDDIAQKVNKAKGALYYYFGSKEEMYQAVLEKEAMLFNEEIRSSVEKVKDSEVKFKVYVLTRIKLITQLTNFYTAFSDQCYNNYPFIAEMREMQQLLEINELAGILRSGIKDGLLEVEEIELTATAVLIAIQGFEHRWRQEEDISEIEKQSDCLRKVLFNGLIKR